jgi:chromate transporter
MLSLVGVGGAEAIIPQVHEEFVTRMHWLDDQTFAEIIVVAQAAPGPNMLFVPLIGWRLGGLSGIVVVLAAYLLPSSVLAITVGRFLHRHHAHRVLTRLRSHLRPLGGGLLIASGMIVLQMVFSHGSNTRFENAMPILAAIVTIIVTMRTKVHPLLMLGIAGLIGVFTR